MKAGHAEHICNQVSVGRGGQTTGAGGQTGQQVLSYSKGKLHTAGLGRMPVSKVKTDLQGKQIEDGGMEVRGSL